MREQAGRGLVMVVVHLAGGQVVQVEEGMTAGIDRIPGGGSSANGLVIRDHQGHIVAVFKWDQVAGWSIGGAAT
jgi:hypothetical protein